MQPIVLATDGSGTAAEAAATAIELAAAADVPLIVLSVWDIPYTGVGSAPVPGTVELGARENRAFDAVAHVAARARRAGVDVRPIIRRGSPVDEICRVAQRRNARLIVIGSHGWGRVKRTLFGSVSEEVVTRAPCPVLVVPACLRKTQQVSRTEV